MGVARAMQANKSSSHRGYDEALGKCLSLHSTSTPTQQRLLRGNRQQDRFEKRTSSKGSNTSARAPTQPGGKARRLHCIRLLGGTVGHILSGDLLQIFWSEVLQRRLPRFSSAS